MFDLAWSLALGVRAAAAAAGLARSLGRTGCMAAACVSPGQWVSSAVSDVPLTAAPDGHASWGTGRLGSATDNSVFSVSVLNPPCPWSSQEGPLSDGSVTPPAVTPTSAR